MSDFYTDYYGDTPADTMASRIRVEVDWDKDSVYTDESDLVRPVQAPVQAQYGRDQLTALAPTVAGTGSFTLDNRSKRFSPRNTASPLYGYLKPARPVKVWRDAGGQAWVLFNGHTDDNPINPDPSAKTVGLTLVDSLADFRGNEISTPLYRGIRTGDAIGYILDACGWDADLRDLDPGATVIPWWWEDGTDALTALDKVLRSEGPPAMLTMGADGSVIFRDRHHRLLDTASLSSQQTWRASGYGLVMATGFSYDEAWKNIINTGTASVDVRIPQGEAAVWTSEATISLSAGEEKLVTASATDPFYDAVVPVAGTDFVQVSGTTTATLFRTSGASATIKLFSSGGASVITGLQLRAKTLAVSYTVQVSASDSESIEQYGPRSFPGDLPWCNQYDAEAVLASAVAQRADPLPTVQARFVVGTDTAKFPLLGRDLSDRVTVVEDETSTDGDFYIESIQHTLTGPLDHEVIFGLEAAPTGADPVFMFDTTGQGFDDGEFGGGLSDPDTVFLFDGSSGHRFDEGAFGI